MFAALRKRRGIEHERQEFLLGIVNKNIVTFSMCRPKDYTPEVTDFMPSRWGRSDESEEQALIRLSETIMNPQSIKDGITKVQ
jgi:hypothetical protein